MDPVFLAFDHRLGRHEEAPHPECPTCLGEPDPIEKAKNKATRSLLWDFVGPAPEAITDFPDWGALWSPDFEHTFVFVREDPHDKAEIGLWTKTGSAKQLLAAPTNVNINPLQIVKPSSQQIELGTGVWHSRTQHVAVSNRVPTDRAPMGVDIATWAAEQNRAGLLKKLADEGMWPITMSVTETEEDHLSRSLIVREWVVCVHVPVLERSAI